MYRMVTGHVLHGVLHNIYTVIANPDFSVGNTVYRDEAILN